MVTIGTGLLQNRIAWRPPSEPETSSTMVMPTWTGDEAGDFGCVTSKKCMGVGVQVLGVLGSMHCSQISNGHLRQWWPCNDIFTPHRIIMHIECLQFLLINDKLSERATANGIEWMHDTMHALPPTERLHHRQRIPHAGLPHLHATPSARQAHVARLGVLRGGVLHVDGETFVRAAGQVGGW